MECYMLHTLYGVHTLWNIICYIPFMECTPYGILHATYPLWSAHPMEYYKLHTLYGVHTLWNIICYIPFMECTPYGIL